MKVLFDGICIWITKPGYAGSRSVCVSLNRHNELTGALESICEFSAANKAAVVLEALCGAFISNVNFSLPNREPYGALA